ncbi:MAG: peptidylprolyl isomerase [Glaciihabitans sp.]|nr:peptidylprolyl isomerase [Glaciihabitans sp.]
MASSKNSAREAREARERLRRYNARQAVHTHQVTRRRRDNIAAIVGLVVVAVLAAGTQIFYFTSGPGKPTASPSSSSTPTPSASATPAAHANVGNIPKPTAATERTFTGTMTLNTDVTLGISLDGKAAPQAVAAFVQQVKDKYFDQKTCHRLVTGTNVGLLQCGSVDGTGAGDTNYSFGPIENAPADGVYKAGTIALARVADNAYSQGHQFFIVFADTSLPADSAGGYTILGHVTSGLDELKTKITNAGYAASATDTSNGAPPKVATTITGVTIK